MKDLLTQAGLNEEQIKAVVDAMAEAKVYTTKEQNIEQRYTKLKQQKEDLNNQLAAANDTIEGLKKSNLTNEGLQKEVEAYKNQVSTIEAEAKDKVRNLVLESAINSKLAEFDEKYRPLVAKAFDRDTLQVDDKEVVIGLDEQYNQIKEQYSSLLANVNPSGVTPVNNVKSPTGVTKEQFLKMGYKEQLELYNTQPEVYQQLTQE